MLVFLPEFREIRQARDELVRIRLHLGPDITILHGRLPPEAQRRVLAAPTGPSHRIILATNIAETSLTIPRVRAVVDSGRLFLFDLGRCLQYTHSQLLPVTN